MFLELQTPSFTKLFTVNPNAEKWEEEEGPTERQ